MFELLLFRIGQEMLWIWVLSISPNFECKYLGTQKSEFDRNFCRVRVKYHSSSIDVLLSHYNNFIFSYFFPNYVILDHSAVYCLNFSGYWQFNSWTIFAHAPWVCRREIHDLTHTVRLAALRRLRLRRSKKRKCQISSSFEELESCWSSRTSAIMIKKNARYHCLLSW